LELSDGAALLDEDATQTIGELTVAAPEVVSEQLGHATVSITLDTYSHAIPAMQEEAAALIAGLVFAAPSLKA
jgi:integrase